MKDKNQLYMSLKKEMSLNKKQIKVLRKVILILSGLFVFASFTLFYITSILRNTKFSMLFISLLCLLFLTLIGIQVLKKNREKEIRSIDSQIYELLRLKI